jgi:cardiolipin synthase
MKNKFNSEKIKLIYNSDEYWKKVWNKIDKSTNEIFIITYDMNNSLLANLTLHKLINAAERGVKIFLIVEEINFFMKKNLISKLKEKGGIILKPNDFKNNLKTFNFFKIFNRFHNKIKLIDNDLFIGSLNCNDDYANYYGKNKFVDLNFYVKNTICKNKIVNFFKNVILNNFKRKNVFFNFNNFNNENNENFNNENNEKFLIESFKNNEISNEIIKSFSNAKKKITIIQSYYMNFKNIEKILLNLLKNGVEIEIITAKIRDPFLLKFYKNEILFENLIKNGAKVYEFLDKSFHCKVYNIDNKIINLGSFNHDIISLWFNNESNYLVKKNEKNKFLFEKFEEIKQKMIKNSKRVLLNNNNNNFNYKFIFKFGYISINYFLFSIGKLLGNSNKLF